MENTVEIQLFIERGVEQALLSDGYSRDSLLNERHRIRGYLFYPEGTSLTFETYRNYCKTMREDGLLQSAPYKRLQKAIEKMELLKRLDSFFSR